MRSKRVDRKELKSQLADLRAKVESLLAEKQTAANSAPQVDLQAEKQAPLQPPVPPIAACGYPILSSPVRPKSLREAKEILLNNQNW